MQEIILRIQMAYFRDGYSRSVFKKIGIRKCFKVVLVKQNSSKLQLLSSNQFKADVLR